MISSRDLATFNRALLDLYAPGLDLESYPGRGFRFLAQLISAELMVHGARNAGSATPNITFGVDRILPELELAVVPFGLLAPKYLWFCGGPAASRGKPSYRSDFYTDREYRSLDIHSEVFRRWGHENFMTLYVHAEAGRIVFFGCSRGRGDFSRKERALLEQAQPHLQAARHLAVCLSTAKPWSLSPQLFAGHGFTPRESEVLYWLTEGKSNIEIATILRIGLPTVKGYLTAIFNKTGTGNRLAATLHAVELAKKLRERQVVRAAGPAVYTAPFGPEGTPPTKVG